MYFIIIQIQRQSSPVFGWFLSVNNSSPIHISIRRPHNDTRINASNVSSLNRLLQSLFTQFCLENSHLTHSCACQAEVAANAESKLHSQNYKSYWNLECLLECQDWSPTMLKVANCSHYNWWHAIFGKAYIVKGETLQSNFLWSAPNKNKNNIKTFLTTKMAFNRCWWLQVTSILNTACNNPRICVKNVIVVGECNFPPKNMSMLWQTKIQKAYC